VAFHDSGRPGCDYSSSGVQFPLFRRIVVPLSATVKHCEIKKKCFTYEEEGITFLRILGTFLPKDAASHTTISEPSTVRMSLSQILAFFTFAWDFSMVLF
jgi:hypothetical protein